MKCQICKKETEFIKEHHIHSKSLGGSNIASNIAKICNDCHDKVHYGLIIIEGNYASTNGITLLWRKFTEPSITGLKDPLVWLKPNSKDLQEKYIRKKKNDNTI